MLIVNAAPPNGPEKAVQRALGAYSGVLVSGLKVLKARGERQSESDSVLLTPTGVYVVEAKGFKRDAPRTGLLTPYQNGSWTLDGVKAEFYGDKAPDDQARNAAQQFKGHLVEKTSVRTFINAAVSVAAGNACKMPEPYVRFGDVVCAMSRDLPEALGVFKPSPLTPEQAWEILNCLGLSPVEMTVSLADLRAQWADTSLLLLTSASRPAASGPTFEEMRLARQATRRADEASSRAADTVVPFPSRPTLVDTNTLPAQNEPAQTEVSTPGCLLVLAMLLAAIGGLGWLGVSLIGGDDEEITRAESIFRAETARKFPKAEIDDTTLVCREGKSIPFDKIDFFCDVYIVRGTRTEHVGGQVSPDFRTVDVEIEKD